MLAFNRWNRSVAGGALPLVAMSLIEKFLTPSGIARSLACIARFSVKHFEKRSGGICHCARAKNTQCKRTANSQKMK
jgi:hypothetical protein